MHLLKISLLFLLLVGVYSVAIAWNDTLSTFKPRSIQKRFVHPNPTCRNAVYDSVDCPVGRCYAHRQYSHVDAVVSYKCCREEDRLKCPGISHTFEIPSQDPPRSVDVDVDAGVREDSPNLSIGGGSHSCNGPLACSRVSGAPGAPGTSGRADRVGNAIFWNAIGIALGLLII